MSSMIPRIRRLPVTSGVARGSIQGDQPDMRPPTPPATPRIALASFCALISFLTPTAADGIPEPDLVLYGAVINTRSNANLRLGHGTLTWTFEPLGGGSPIVVRTDLANIDNQFSYILRLSAETPIPGFNPTVNTLPLTPSPIAYDRALVSWEGLPVTFADPGQTLTTVSTADRGRLERIDLYVSVPIVIDANGLPVDWELLYFGRTGIDAAADADNDGMSNLAEYLAGTDPTDPDSALAFTEATLISGGIRLGWPTTGNQTYIVQRSVDLSQGFVDVATGVVSTPPLTSWTDTSATGPGPYFYRLRLGP